MQSFFPLKFVLFKYYIIIQDDIEIVKKYCSELDTPEKRYTFAEKLREALRQSSSYTESTDDSYAVDISISGSKTDPDEGIRLVAYFTFYTALIY